MTGIQAANRQADHENLIQELIRALQAIVSEADTVDPHGFDLPNYLRKPAEAVLAKAKEQGYA